jgi:hypothetical protein
MVLQDAWSCGAGRRRSTSDSPPPEAAVHDTDNPSGGPPPSFAGLGGEQRFRAEVARITAGADATGRWLEDLRPSLRQLVDYDAAWIGRFDVGCGRYLPLLEDGDAEPLRRLFASEVAAAEVQQLGFRQPGWPMLGHKIMPRLAQLRGWNTYLAPAGFRDGLGVGLLTRDGRHVGYLTLLTYEPGVALAMAAALLHGVTPLIADAVDRFADSD